MLGLGKDNDSDEDDDGEVAIFKPGDMLKKQANKSSKFDISKLPKIPNQSSLSSEQLNHKLQEA